MKKVVDQYSLNRILSRMAKEYGKITLEEFVQNRKRKDLRELKGKISFIEGFVKDEIMAI